MTVKSSGLTGRGIQPDPDDGNKQEDLVHPLPGRPRVKSTIEPGALAALQAENARLAALLESNGIEWRLTPEPAPPVLAELEPLRLSTDDKVTLFRRLFRGRNDVYPIR